MIVRPRPRTFELLFALRGSIVPRVAPRVLLVASLSLVAVWLHGTGRVSFPQFSAAPFGLLGIALSIFLGFRNNSCYDRWWEARKLWGQLISTSRAFAREAVALLPEAEARRLLRRNIGFAAWLGAHLRRGESVSAAAPWLPAAEAAALPGLQNRGEAILRAQAADLGALRRQGLLSDILYGELAAHLATMGVVQAGAERIHSTPTPFAYTLLLHRTAWLFCLLMPVGFVGTLGAFTPIVVALLAYTLFGLDALSDELEEPFGEEQNDLPVNALVRVIESDTLEALGEPDPPPPLRPERFVLL